MSTILIVDDKEENRYLLQALLGGHGHTVHSARHGAEALAMARQTPPDAVISDLLMPVMDGYTLLRHWQADPRLRAIPFIVYTATYTEPEDERLALDMGADAFILKPAEPDAFLARLDEVQGRGPRAQAPPPDAAQANQARLLEEYSETLIRKLEEKSLQLEQANRALREDIRRREAAEATLRMASQVAHIGAWAVSLPERTLTWSDEVCAIHEIPADQMPAIDEAIAYYVPEHRERIRDALACCMHEGTAFDHELQILTATQRRVWIRTIGQAVRDEHDAIIRVQGAIQDISGRKQAQRLEAIGQMTGGVAHDFNNLLTVILGNAEMLCERLSGSAAEHALAAMIATAAQRGADLTQRLLAFARKQMLEPEVVDLNRMVDSMHELLHRTLGEHIEIDRRQDPALWPALVDPAQLESALLNLAINARDAMPQGGRLTIETCNVTLDEQFAHTHLEVEPGDYALMAVTDTGSGIATANLERVFEPFFTTKDTGKGTGLGLAMVHGFVKQSGGHVSIYSEPEHGTSVKLYLPRADDGGVAAHPRSEPVAVGGQETVLLVEDDDLVRRFALTQLQSLGYRVLEAGSGPQALEILRTDAAIDLLFTDVVMPGGMSGPELGAQATQLRPALRVLYTSGYTESAAGHFGNLAPGTQLLPKPWRRNELASKIRAVLDTPG